PPRGRREKEARRGRSPSTTRRRETRTRSRASPPSRRGGTPPGRRNAKEGRGGAPRSHSSSRDREGSRRSRGEGQARGDEPAAGAPAPALDPPARRAQEEAPAHGPLQRGRRGDSSRRLSRNLLRQDQAGRRRARCRGSRGPAAAGRRSEKTSGA